MKTFFLAEIYHQYDGIVVPNPSKKYFGWTGGLKVEKYEEEIIETITFAIKYFFPKWKGFMLGRDLPSISCKEALQCVDLIHKGFWKSYGEYFQHWKHDYINFRGFIGKV